MNLSQPHLRGFSGNMQNELEVVIVDDGWGLPPSGGENCQRADVCSLYASQKNQLVVIGLSHLAQVTHRFT